MNPGTSSTRQTTTMSVKLDIKKLSRGDIIEETANREIKESQDSSDLLIDKREFQAVLRGVAREIDPDIHFQSAAIAILQEAAEGHTVALLRDSQVIADHNKRKTVLPRDIALARYLHYHH